MIRHTIIVLNFLLIAFFSAGATERIENELTDSVAQRLIPEVEVKSLLNEKLNFPLQSIEATKLDKRAYMTPAEALHSLSGVSVSRDGIWATSVNIRGFSESKLLFLMDGDRVQTASDIAGALSTIDLGNIERIELIKGAGSVLYGTGAMGGIVNFVYKNPGYSDQIHTSGNVSSGFQTVNNLWQNNVLLSVSHPGWYLMANGSYRTAQNTMTPAGLLANSQFNDASWGIKGGLRNGGKQELLFNYQHFEAWNTGIPGGSAFPATAVVRYLGFDRNQLNGEYVFRDISRLIKELRFKAYTQNVSRSVENKVNPTTVILPGSRNVTSGLKATADLYFNDYHTMTVGVDGWLRDQRTTRYKINTQADTIVIGEQPTPKASMFDAGVFALYTWKPDPKYWTVNAGVRVDFIQTENDTAFKEVFKYKYVKGVKTEMTANRSVLFPEDINRNLTYAAHVDVAYKPADRNQFTLSLANAYRVASLEERFKYIDQAGKLMVGNPALKPENGLFSNLGYSFTGNKLIVNVNIFGNYLFNLIGEETGTYTTSTGTIVPAIVYKNVDQAVFYGGELDLKWLIINNLEFESSVSYVQANDAISGDELTFIPPLHGLNALQYQLSKIGGVTVSMNWQYKKSETSSSDPNKNQYMVFDCYLNSVPVSFGKTCLVLNAGVKNLLNTSYAEYFSTLRGVNKLEPGRNFFVKAKISW